MVAGACDCCLAGEDHGHRICANEPQLQLTFRRAEVMVRLDLRREGQPDQWHPDVFEYNAHGVPASMGQFLAHAGDDLDRLRVPWSVLLARPGRSHHGDA